jgi:peptidyl-tRNA hydrolase, PTH2 family
METKQVLVMRKDLNMRKGKMIAQGAHAAMKVLLDRAHKTEISYVVEIFEGDPMYYWLSDIFTKVVVGCSSEEELLLLKSVADMKGIRTALIQDAGKTEFHGEPTYTALAIGPDDIDIIDEVTGHLKLL